MLRELWISLHEFIAELLGLDLDKNEPLELPKEEE